MMDQMHSCMYLGLFARGSNYEKIGTGKPKNEDRDQPNPKAKTTEEAVFGELVAFFTVGQAGIDPQRSDRLLDRAGVGPKLGTVLGGTEVSSLHHGPTF